MKYFFLCLVIFSLACSKNEQPQSGLQKVTLQLNWMPEAEHGGYYEALRQGYFKELGLDVEILPGGPGVRVESEVALGRVEFGIANADKILVVRDKGMPLVALMSPFEKSPRCLMTHKGSEISDFESLVKAKVLILNNTKPFYFWLKQKYPAIADMDTIPYNKATFMTTKASVMQGYLNSEPLIMKAKGVDVNVLKVSDTGFNPYTSVLITGNKLLTENSALVDKMKQASVKGWLSYLKSPSVTNAHIEKLNPANKGTLDQSTAALMDLMSQQDDKFGQMNSERWQELASQLKELGILEKVPTETKSFLK